MSDLDLSLVPALTTRREDSLKGLQKIVSRGLGWARKYSIFIYPYSTACCAMEYMSVASARYDIARFGSEFPRFSPRQADLLLVVGTINQKQAPILKRVYEQMCEPKWVVAFGVCASSGGFYDNYAVLQGIDRVIPVDVYIPGCPPRPEQVLDGLMLLQQKIQSQPHRLVEREQKQAALAAERPGEVDLLSR
ncbi:MAG TPA: NADH-quinone oxidoreductase subunit B [Myxococcales bacterium]|jgi:NADH-quinone oxidoreductase subunit B